MQAGSRHSVEAGPPGSGSLVVTHRSGVASMHPITLAMALSQVGITTRTLDRPNHAQNRFVDRPATLGPCPQSHWAHMPGSGTHGRYTRRRDRR